MSTFAEVDDCIQRLHGAFELIENRKPDAEMAVRRVATAVQQVCKADEDGALAALHLFKRDASTQDLPVYYAILCEVMGREYHYSEQRRMALVCAALTANVSYMEFQERLNHQSEPLTEVQRHRIYRHPLESVAILREVGVSDPLWLKIVAQHHEREDGSGYPEGLTAAEIDPGAEMLLVSETYCAEITCRAYRKRRYDQSNQHATTAMLQLYKSSQHGQPGEHDLLQAFIKKIGVYPPGSWVELACGEVAIVVRRQGQASAPIVRSFLNRQQALYPTPMLRDTSDPDYRVTGIATPPERRARIHMSSLWG